MNVRKIFKTLRDNKSRRDYPSKKDARYEDGVIFPEFRPKFGIDFEKEGKVFTIGSCFAREIEEEIVKLGVSVPTADYAVPEEESPGPRRNAILNEYNPGTMTQRIINALSGVEADPRTLMEVRGGVNDLLLRGGKLVSMERAIERRKEVTELYTHLPSADVLIVTLGLVEAWFDMESKQYVNGMPGNVTGDAVERFQVRRMDVHDIMPMFDKAFGMLAKQGIKVVVTVSPVPLGLTFFDNDCAVSNEFSKSVLRVCADRVYRKYDNVDYYPSYEIVRSGGVSAFGGDNLHVRREVVGKITNRMIAAYSEKARQTVEA